MDHSIFIYLIPSAIAISIHACKPYVYIILLLQYFFPSPKLHLVGEAKLGMQGLDIAVFILFLAICSAINNFSFR